MYTMEMYNALVQAIATGAKEVKYHDKWVIYRDLDEMLNIKAQMERELGIDKSPKRRYAEHSKGI